MNEILANLLIIAIPFIKKLIESKVVPIIKRKAYERLDDFSNDRIEDLTELLAKIKNSDDDVKKEAHLEGFKLGVDTLGAIGEKLVKASSTLKAEVA